MMATQVLNHKDTKDTRNRSRRCVTFRRIFALFVSSLCLCGSVAQAQEAPRRLMLQLPDSPVVDTAKALSMLLGAEVTVEGAGARRAGLLVTGETPVELLDRVAGAYSAAWTLVYTVTPGRESDAPSTAAPTGRTVSLAVEGLAARPALAMVARAAGARLITPDSLSGSVTLTGDALPVEAAMDQVTAQIGASWRPSYVLTVPEPPAAPPVETGGAPLVEPPSPPVSITPAPGSVTAPPETPEAGLGVASLRTALTTDLARLLQTDPDARRPAVERYAARLETLLSEVAPVGRPRPHLAPLRPFFRSGLRAFGGLTPDQQDEFRPVYDLLKRWMP